MMCVPSILIDIWCTFFFVPRCGEDFYIGVTDGMYTPFTQVTSAWTATDEDMKDEETLRRFKLMREAMEKKFGAQVGVAVFAGGCGGCGDV